MSQIESFTKPVLTSLIKYPSDERTLTDEQVTTLILWVTLKAIVVDHHDVLANNGMPFFTPRQKQRFRDDLVPPNRCSIWLARLSPVLGFGGKATADYVIWPTVKPLKHLHAYAFTFGALEVAIQALFLKNLSRPKRYSVSAIPDRAYRLRRKDGVPWDDLLIQIHPGTGDVRWEPPPQLGDNGFDALSKRLSAGRSPWPIRGPHSAPWSV